MTSREHVIGLLDEIDSLVGRASPELLERDDVREALDMVMAYSVSIEPLPEPDTPQRRMAAMREGFLSSFTETGQPLQIASGHTVREHQPRIFTGIAREITSGPDEHGAITIALDCAPNVGKTFVAVETVKALGVGQEPSEGSRPLRALQVVPRLKAARQTVQAYSQFAPDIKVGEYFNGNKEIADVTVITNKALELMSEEAFQAFMTQFDVRVIDEVHRSYGRQTAPRLRRAFQEPGKINMLMSASLDYNAKRTLASELGVERIAARIGFREAIEDGIAEEAQIVLLATDTKLKVSSHRGVFEGDVRPLVTDKGRNSLIIEVMRAMVEEGRPGIVRCVAGGNSQHARDLARMASEHQVFDSGAGEMRNLRAAAVGGFQSDTANEAVLQLLARRELDAVLFTDYLVEAYDEPAVEYVFDVQPRSSLVELSQEFGRGMRFNRGERKPTLYFQLVDQYYGRGENVSSFLSVVDEPIFKAATVVRRKTNNRQTNVADGKGSAGEATGVDEETGALEIWDYTGASEVIRRAVESVAGKTVAELTIIAKAYGPAPSDWVPVSSLSIYRDYSHNNVINILNQCKIGICRGERGALHCPPDTEARLAKLPLVEVADDTAVSYADLGRSHRLHPGLIDTLAKEVGATPFMARSKSATRPRAWHLSAGDARLVLAYLENNYPPVDPEVEVPLVDIAAEFNLSRAQLRVRLSTHQIPSHVKFGRNRRSTTCLTHENAEVLRRLLRLKPASGAVRIEDIATRRGQNVDELRAQLQSSPYVEHIKGDSHADWLMPEQAKGFESWLDAQPDSPQELRDGAEIWLQLASAQPLVNPAGTTAPRQKKPRKQMEEKHQNPQRIPKDGAMDAFAIAAMNGLTTRQVRVVIERLQAAGKLKDVPPAIVRQAKQGGQTKHYRDAALKIIQKALETEAR